MRLKNDNTVKEVGDGWGAECSTCWENHKGKDFFGDRDNFGIVSKS
jgi:hypothetical protein